MQHDAIVIGGSIAGLLTAREIAKRGFSVLVLEEDAEIGTPEHCGGLVSRNALKALGIDEYTILSRIRHATVSVLNTTISIDAERQDVVAVDRRALDKHVAKQASRNGADIMLMCRARSFAVKGEQVKVDTSRGAIECRVLVDARGCSVPASSGKGFFPSAQYEVDSASWIDADRVEVYIDQEKYPGFFAWIIPSGKGRGRVGVSGKGINVMDRLEKFIVMKEMLRDDHNSSSSSNSGNDDGNSNGDGYVSSSSRCVVLRKVFAPIWVDGPQRPFISNGGRVVMVGDAAGQAKPTTAGGIYTSGMGGVLAGNAIADALAYNNLNMLNRYEDGWLDLFGKEFERMIMLRRIFERLDNKAIERILLAIRSQIDKISVSGDFDFHSSAMARMLVSRDGLSIVKTMLGSEFRRFLASVAKI
ncbi:MAG: NAD(P)/FAD-dependent oxidoreductase [Candidatus Nitrosocaldus sp.]